MGQVNTELSLTSTASINMGASNVRDLAGVASGAISMSNLHGKSALSAYINEASFDGVAFDMGSGATAQTGFANLTVTGGSGAITYQWYLTGTAGLTTPTASTTKMSISGSTGTTASGTVWCVVTRNGVSKTTATKAYTLSIEYGGA